MTVRETELITRLAELTQLQITAFLQRNHLVNGTDNNTEIELYDQVMIDYAAAMYQAVTNMIDFAYEDDDEYNGGFPPTLRIVR